MSQVTLPTPLISAFLEGEAGGSQILDQPGQLSMTLKILKGEWKVYESRDLTYLLCSVWYHSTYIIGPGRS